MKLLLAATVAIATGTAPAPADTFGERALEANREMVAAGLMFVADWECDAKFSTMDFATQVTRASLEQELQSKDAMLRVIDWAVNLRKELQKKNALAHFCENHNALIKEVTGRD